MRTVDKLVAQGFHEIILYTVTICDSTYSFRTYYSLWNVRFEDGSREFGNPTKSTPPPLSQKKVNINKNNWISLPDWLDLLISKSSGREASQQINELIKPRNLPQCKVTIWFALGWLPYVIYYTDLPISLRLRKVKVKLGSHNTINITILLSSACSVRESGPISVLRIH